MDFLDIQFASVEKAKYAGFLGLDKLFTNGKSMFKSSGRETVYRESLQNDFPFSENCGMQREIVYKLQMEINNLLETKNILGPQAQIDWQFLIINDYLQSAIDYMDNVSCPVSPVVIENVTLSAAKEDQVLNSMQVSSAVIYPPAPAATKDQGKQLIKGVDNKILGLAAAGIVVMALSKIIKL